MHPAIPKRCSQFLVVLFFVATLSSCQPSNIFTGSVLLVNRTGQDMQAISLQFGAPPAVTFGKTAHQQAWLKDFQHVPTNGSITVSWQAPDGKTLSASETLFDHLPQPCFDDLLIEVFGQNSIKLTVFKLPK
ncbi:MAG: hypothetical protein K8T91_04915 [Planctomycetes bacterium]|nr:hypothetical protein [Planctomycetota bacterium]